MSEINFPLVRKRLLRWYYDNKRDLPWRQSSDPYAIWLAETMLQQTQVKTALPYYDKFIAAFPSIETLACAPLQRILRLWSGLGYYRRAKNLKEGARQIVRNHDGRMPEDYAQLRTLPGIGDYTAGAILSIAFQKSYPAIDGNVRRVFARMFSVTDEKLIRTTAARLVPQIRPGDFNQALMELGATICTPQKPRCPVCPVKGECASRQANRAEPVTLNRQRAKFRRVTWPLAIVYRNKKILLCQRSADGLLASLWELPGLQLARGEKIRHFSQYLEKQLLLKLAQPRRIGAIRHTITNRRIRAPIYVFDLDADSARTISSGRWRWIAPGNVQEQPISAMTAKAVKIFAEHEKSLY